MAKAMLIMDMPECCDYCNLHYENRNYEDICFKENKYIETNVYTEKPSWCPLREVPKKKEAQKINPYEIHKIEYNKGYRQGYNNCIDDILGE